jgi:hypothetical protein
MGMFDRDKNFGECFSVGDRFIITSLHYDGELTTVHGQAQKSRAGIVVRGESLKPEKYSLLGEGFAEQAKRAEVTDFPAVVEYVKIPTTGDKEVKRFEPIAMDPNDWFNGDDGPALILSEAAASPSSEDVAF